MGGGASALMAGRRRNRVISNSRAGNSPAAASGRAGGTPVVYTTPRLSVNTGDNSGIQNCVGGGGDDETDTSYRLTTGYSMSANPGEGVHSNASTPIASVVTPGRETKMRTSLSSTPQGAMALQYPYNCPLCFEYFADILYTPGCCGNYICVQCCMDYLGTQGITSDAASINEVLTKLKKDQLKSDTCDRVSCPQCLNSAKGYCPEKVEKETSTTTGEEHNWDDGASTSAAGGTEPTAAPVKRSEGIAFKADNNVSQGFIAGSADVRSPKAEERAMDKVEGVDGLMEKEAFPQSLQGSPSTHTIHIYSSSIDLSSPSTNSAIDNTTANIATHMSSAGSVNTTTRSGCRGLVGRPPVPTNSASNATNARKVMSNSKRKPLASLATNSATNNVNNANVPSLALHSPVKVGDSFETLKRKMRMGSFKRGDSGSQIQNENNENSIVNNNNNTGLGSCLGTEDVTASNTNSNCTAGPPSADPLEESQESDDGMDIRKAEDARYPLSPLRSLAFSLTTSQTDEQQQVPAFLLSSFVNECVEEALSTRVSKERAMHA